MSRTAVKPRAEKQLPADLLVLSLNGDRVAMTNLFDLFNDQLVKQAYKYVPAGSVEDAAQQTWELLLRQPSSAFDPSHVSVQQFMLNLLRIAARSVRASMRAPGSKSRPGKDAFTLGFAEVFLDEAVDCDNDTVTRHEITSVPQAEYLSREVDLDFELLLSKIPGKQAVKLRLALEEIYWNGLDDKEAAQRAGLSRFQLIRAKKQLRNRYELPLAI